MYQKPELQRLGTLRELTLNGSSFGVDLVDLLTDASAPTCNPNSPLGSPSAGIGVCRARGSN